MDKCFCHLNGYAVKDAEARNRIEVLEQGGVNAVDPGYYLLNLPLGNPVTSMPFGELSFDITEAESLAKIGEVINKCHKNGISKPIIKIANSSVIGSVEEDNISYPPPTEITYINTSTPIVKIQPNYILYGVTLQLENMLWRSKLELVGNWDESTGEAIYTCNSANITLYEEVENAGGSEIKFIKTTIDLTTETLNASVLLEPINEALADYFNNGSELPLLYIEDSKSIPRLYKPSIITSSQISYVHEEIYLPSGSYAYTSKYKKLNLTISNNSVTKVAVKYYENSILHTGVTAGNYTPTNANNPATKGYVDDSISNLTPTTTTGTFTLEGADVSEGASATWKVNKIGKMCVLDIEATIPIGNDLIGCQFKTTSLNPIPNGVYGTRVDGVIVAVSNTDGVGICELVGFNTSEAVANTPRLQLIYFID